MVVACGRAAEGPTKSPAPRAASPSPSVAAGRLPGTVVDLTVNGKQHRISQPVRASGDLPTIVVLTFPFAVERAAIETWLPGDAKTVWRDDRSLELRFEKADSSISFKVPEARAAIGGTVIDWFSVDITFPDARLIRLYTQAALLGQADWVRQPTMSIRAPRGDGLTLSPDGRTAIVFDGFGPDTGPAPTLFDLDTKVATPLAQPPASDGWFSFADWLPDGRLVMVGRSVWVGDARGGSMRRIADAVSAVNGYPWVAVPDLNGRRLALWGYNTDGHIAVIDLGDGSVTRVIGPFRRSCADCAVGLAWSADGTKIAGTDSAEETGHKNARLRIVDVASDRTTRTLEGDVLSVTGLPTGDIIVTRTSGETGAGARHLGIRMDFELIERARYLGCAWSMSPDQRYLLQSECGGAGYPSYTLTDLRTGSSQRFGLDPAASDRWLSDGRFATY